VGDCLVTGYEREHLDGCLRGLLREALTRAGGLRIDLVSYFDPFYEAVASRRFSGFRITWEDLSRGDSRAQ
jgi:hypothetical protein